MVRGAGAGTEDSRGGRIGAIARRTVLRAAGLDWPAGWEDSGRARVRHRDGSPGARPCEIRPGRPSANTVRTPCEYRASGAGRRGRSNYFRSSPDLRAKPDELRTWLPPDRNPERPRAGGGCRFPSGTYRFVAVIVRPVCFVCMPHSIDNPAYHRVLDPAPDVHGPSRSLARRMRKCQHGATDSRSRKIDRMAPKPGGPSPGSGVGPARMAGRR